MDFYISRVDILIPIVLVGVWSLGLGCIGDILLLIWSIITEFKFQLLIILVNVYGLWIFLNRIKFSIHVKVDYVPGLSN